MQTVRESGNFICNWTLHFATRYMGREGFDCVFSTNPGEGEGGKRTQAVQLAKEENNIGLFTCAQNSTFIA